MIPKKQIGWSQENSLLWEISKQLDKTITTLHTTGTVITTTTIVPITTTTTTADPCPNCVQGTVNINGQIWDTCNLNVETYRDGTVIPQYTGNNAGWASLTTGAWCYHNNDPANEAIYGKLYNAYALLGIYDAASLADPLLRRTFAPIGKRIPTNTEWSALTTFLGGQAVAGGVIKQAGLCHWETPNTGATNLSGFTALGAGNRSGISGTFGGIKLVGIWWSSTQQSVGLNFNYSVDYSNTTLLQSFATWDWGFSVRCLND